MYGDPPPLTRVLGSELKSSRWWNKLFTSERSRRQHLFSFVVNEAESARGEFMKPCSDLFVSLFETRLTVEPRLAEYSLPFCLSLLSAELQVCAIKAASIRRWVTHLGEVLWCVWVSSDFSHPNPERALLGSNLCQPYLSPLPSLRGQSPVGKWSGQKSLWLFFNDLHGNWRNLGDNICCIQVTVLSPNMSGSNWITPNSSGRECLFPRDSANSGNMVSRTCGFVPWLSTYV